MQRKVQPVAGFSGFVSQRFRVNKITRQVFYRFGKKLGVSLTFRAPLQLAGEQRWPQKWCGTIKTAVSPVKRRIELPVS